MFCGAAQGKATEAVDFYTEIFDVAFSDFQLADQWFDAMDSGLAQPFSFTPGVSLMLVVQDLAELDRYWVALSANPEAEQCGWLEDRYGLSWQIVPQNLPDLLSRPQDFENMLKMKKLIIDEF